MSAIKIALPDRFIQTVIGLCGEEGRAWLDALPILLAEAADRWSLTIDLPFSLSYHYVAPGVRADGTAVVVKLGRPDAEFAQELAALRWFDGNGTVRVLDAVPEQRMMLLERVVPGTTLLDLVEQGDDEAATEIIGDTIARIRRPVPPEEVASLLPKAMEWGEGMQRLRERFHGGSGPFPDHLVDLAEGYWRDLLASTTEFALVHGDLHHFNVLARADGTYCAIDPKGLIAAPCYEVGPLFYNPNPFYARHPDAQRLCARRVAILAERTGFSRERIRAWAVAQTVLSAWWCIEDGSDMDAGEEAILCAEHAASVRV